ncbi:MAG TPA: hypothetical protein PK022_00475 [Syntrophales bacterium]|nr:hypothetical protein [Syntrophales bacterium]
MKGQVSYEIFPQNVPSCGQDNSLNGDGILIFLKKLDTLNEFDYRFEQNPEYEQINVFITVPTFIRNG